MQTVLFYGFENLTADLGISVTAFWVIFAVVTIWTLVLKGFALWYSARNYQRRWFVALLIINTFGVLELVYLLRFRKDKDASRTQSLFNTPAGPAANVA